MMDEQERAELISRMFALITMKCEDGAAAATCQGRWNAERHQDLASQLLVLSEESVTVAAALLALLSSSN